jgi:hypothetical protein
MNQVFKIGKAYQNYVFPEECVVILKIFKSEGDVYVEYQCMHEPDLIEQTPIENFEDWYGEC